jgi:hypothetical protein
MTKQRHIIHLTVILSLLTLYGCPEITRYSEIPQITYLSHSIKDSTNQLGNDQKFLVLTFDVIDGDGDIGLSPADTVAPYDSIFQYNFFPTLLVKKDGLWDTSNVNENETNYRIPYIEVENHKAYKAEIDVEFQFFDATLPGDTVKYEFYILDRAFHKSNVEITPEIVF